MRKYADLINQTFDFPTPEFKVIKNHLHFHGIDLMEIIKQYGTPLKLSYLPKIASSIRFARKIFNSAIKKHNYAADYQYAYCTKSSHFRFVVEKALEQNVHLETSSAYDIPIVRSLEKGGKLTKEHFIICNGFKRPLYVQEIANLLNSGYRNCIPVLDNLHELDFYLDNVDRSFNVGIRVAADEEPNFSFYTSRLGIRYNDILPHYKERIKGTSAKLRMLHFFINTGIQDTTYYWSELNRFISKYCELKKICPELDSIDIGGGLPIKNNLYFKYDYAYMADQIVGSIQSVCKKNQVPVPRIFTEFGSFTVGESGATIYSVLDQKLQNDKELWYMIDGSFITNLPDVWASNEKYIMLAINQWKKPYHKVNLGGLTCDSMDYYDAEAHIGEVFLPQFEKNETLYFGFFHTGAYQESLGGYGGIQHCLIPAPKHVIIDQDDNGDFQHHLFAPEQESDAMMRILGY
ncbi:MAG: arginine decarboxylase [Bacteroidota bacterium]